MSVGAYYQIDWFHNLKSVAVAFALREGDALSPKKERSLPILIVLVRSTLGIGHQHEYTAQSMNVNSLPNHFELTRNALRLLPSTLDDALLLLLRGNMITG